MNAVASSGGAPPVRRLERDGARRRVRLRYRDPQCSPLAMMIPITNSALDASPLNDVELDWLQATSLVLYPRVQSHHGADPGQDAGRGAGQHRRGRHGPVDGPGVAERGSAPARLHGRIGRSGPALLRQQPAGDRARRHRIQGLLLSLPRHGDGPAGLELRAVDDRLGVPVRRDARRRDLLRPRRCRSSRDPHVSPRSSTSAPTGTGRATAGPR